MKKQTIYFSFLLTWFVLSNLLAACSTEDIGGKEPEGKHTCRLVWDGEIGTYGNGTRALREKQDGDCVLLRFRSGNNYVNGKAVYDLSANEWILTYNGSLTKGETSSCQAYFFEDEVEGNSISLHQGIVVCRDVNAQYTKDENCVRLSAKLYPATGRIRFKGEAGRSFLFSGVSYYTAFNTETFELTTAQTPLEMAVGNDGFTPYVHAIPLAERTLTIYYDYQTYKTPCESPILDAGRSGYMLLPTEGAHNGWGLVKVELPTLSEVTIDALSDVTVQVNASVTSLGNGTLLDAGFVYAETENPTLDSHQVSCGAVTVFTGTLRDLKPVTEYYVRAYATNERGVNYGEQMKFKTTDVPTAPIVKTGTVSEIKMNKAVVSGTIVSLGEVSTITEYGHVWSVVPNPTISDSKTQLGSTTNIGDYVSNLIGLAPSTTYYVRAYATNKIGTSYGDDVSFTTEEDRFKLETTRVRTVKHDKATVEGKVIEKGIHYVLELGVCWSTNPNPTINDNKSKSLSSLDSCSLTISGLQEKTTYYASVYAKIESGEYFYGNVCSFRTSSKNMDLNLGEFDDEEDWSKDKSSNGNVDREEFGEDEDWSKDQSDKGNVGRTDYSDEDEDWSKESSSRGNVGRSDYGNDEDWSKDNGSDNGVGLNGFDDDEDWTSDILN